jgi:hypothetical protein
LAWSKAHSARVEPSRETNIFLYKRCSIFEICTNWKYFVYDDFPLTLILSLRERGLSGINIAIFYVTYQ